MKKKNYESPVVEVFEAKVEHGFAGSDVTRGTESLQDGESYNENDFLFS